jgi:hypothetical protein
VTARGIASFVHHTPHAGCIDVAVDKRNPLARILSCATSLTDNAFLTDIVYQHRGTAPSLLLFVRFSADFLDAVDDEGFGVTA